jgi:hypothetical protein
MAGTIPPKPGPTESSDSWLFSFLRLTGLLVLASVVPLAFFLPAGPKLIWGLVVSALPLGIAVAGYYAWRRICPLAFLATLGQRFKLQRKRKVNDWFAAHGLEVQLALLAIGMAWRHLGANSTAWALAGLFALVIMGATAVGFLFTGKTWCNHLCPVGVIEKIYQEPSLLLPGEGNSQCATCSACKKNCPDIDLEQAYWKELDSAARSRVYYLWPGLVLAFFCYFYFAEGTWSNYLSGAWSRDPHLISKILGPGFFFAPVIPRLVAVPLTFLLFGLASLFLFSMLEKGLLARHSEDGAGALARHQCLALAGFAGFTLFYGFACRTLLANFPIWCRELLTLGIAMVATALLLMRWARNEASFVQEKLAKGLLKRWEWGDAPPSNRLSDIYLVHQERVQQRDARLKAYKATVRDLLAEGVLNRGNLLMLQTLRAQLGIAEKEHDKLLSELSLEEKQLFEPGFQGSREKRLQLDQYRHELESILLGDHKPDAAALQSLQQIHRIRPEEHAQVMEDLRGDQGPMVSRLQDLVRLTLDLRRAGLAADDLVRGDRLLQAREETGRRLSYFHYVLRWRQGQLLDQILHLLAVGLQEPQIQDRRQLLDASGNLEQTFEYLGAMTDCGAMGAALIPLTAKGASSGDIGSALRLVAQDHSPFMRASALTLLAYLGDEASDKVLRGALMDPAPLVRETAQSLLGVPLGLEPTLTALAEDEEQWLLRAAVQSLPKGTLGPKQAAGEHTLGKVPDYLLPAVLGTLDRLMFLQGVPIFAQLEPDDLVTLASTATVRTMAPDEVLCRQGDLSDEVFLLLKGRVRAWIRDQDGRPRSLGDSGEGACIGEMAVLDPAPRAATVSALTAGLVLVLQGRLFMEMLHERPTIAEGVLRVLTRRLRSMIHAAS